MNPTEATFVIERQELIEVRFVVVSAIDAVVAAAYSEQTPSQCVWGTLVGGYLDIPGRD